MNCLVATPHRYGIREVAERVGAEWEAMGHEVSYELAYGEAARIGPVTVGTPGIAIWWYRTLNRIAGQESYDLVWVHQPVAPMLPTRSEKLWNRTLVTFHTTLRAEYELVRDGIYPRVRRPVHRLNKTLEARFYRALEALDVAGPRYTVVAPHLRDEIGAFGVEDAAYIPNGIMAPDRAAAEPIRQELDIPEDDTLVVNLGSLTPQKRAARCARVLRAVTERADDVHCVIAGKGPLEEAVAAQASDRVHVLGYVSDDRKWQWLADADVFVSLSAYEGMPVASLEALSFGVPVVLSDIPAHRNVIDAHGAAGELVTPDAGAVLAGIRRIAGQGTGGGVNLPDWRAIAEAYLDAWRAPTDATPSGGGRLSMRQGAFENA